MRARVVGDNRNPQPSMSTAPNNDQERFGLRPSKGPSGANRTDSILASFARAMLSDSRRAAAIFWAGGVVAVLASIPLGRWSFRTLIVLGILAGACGTALASPFRVFTPSELGASAKVPVL
jgi:hypothetical protein